MNQTIFIVEGELSMDATQKDLEAGFKVVSIMQTITEELDERSRKMLRKMFCIEHPREEPLTVREEETNIEEVSKKKDPRSTS